MSTVASENGFWITNRPNKRYRKRKPKTSNTTNGVSAIQARLINARNEVKITTKVDDWESCKERVRLEKCKLNILMDQYEKHVKDVDAVKPIESTSRRSDSTAEEAQLQPLLKRLRPILKNKPTSGKVAVITKDVKNMHIYGEVPEVDLSPFSRVRTMRNEEQWEKCKERVRLEREKMRKMYAISKAGRSYGAVDQPYDATGHSYNRAGHPYDAAGHSYNRAGHSYNRAGHPYDAAGHFYEAAGHSYDAADHFYNAAGHSYKGAGHPYDAAGHYYEAAGHSHDAAGHFYNAAGHSYNGAGHPYDAAGHFYEAAGHSYDAAGHFYDAAG